MADPHLRPGGPLRDRRADAQSHIRGYRSSCGPHLASSGAAAGGSLGIARAGLPVRMGNGAPPSPGLGLAISRDAGGLSRAGVAARRIVQSLRRGPSPDAPRLLIAHRPSPIAHRPSPIAHRPGDEGHLGRQRGGLLRVPADVEQHARHLGGRGGVGLAGHRASGDQLPATSEEPSRAGPRVLADREGHRRPAPLAARRVAPREDPGTLDERLAHERPSVPRDAAQPPALGARALRGREAEVGRGLSPGREAGEVSHLGGERERRGEDLRPSRTRARRRAAPGRRPWRSPRPWPPARRRRPRPTRRPREPRGRPPATRHRPDRRGAASSRSAGPSASRACRSACARPTICRVGTGSHSRAGAPPRGRRPGRPSPGPARAAPRPARGAPWPG